MAQKKDFIVALLAMSTSVIPFAGAARAEEAMDSTAGYGEEIIVTAQRRAERASDTPLSLAVVSGDGLEMRKVSQMDDIAQGLANVQFSATVGENTPIFAIRGVSMSDFSLNQSSPVALYYDDVYKGNFALMGLALYDLDRVEVLRGPQGTLYGRNSTGGAINVVSRQPTFENSGSLTLGIGNYNRVESNGAVNALAAENLAVRFAFTAARADGWFRNLLPGKRDLNGTREYGARASFRWEPASGARIDLKLSTSRQNPSNYGSLSVPGAAGTGAGVYEMFGVGQSYFRTGLSSTQLEASYTPRRHARTWSAALTGSFELAQDLTLASITAWDKGSLFIPEDTDGSPLRTLEIPYTDRARQISQELRLTRGWGSGNSILVGLYAAREKVFNKTEMYMWPDVDVDGNGHVDGADCAAALPVACVIANRFDQRKTSLAGYFDAHLRLADEVLAQFGLRVTRDTGRQHGLVGEARGVDGTLVQTFIPPTRRSFVTTHVSGKAGLEWRPGGDLLVYATIGSGYRGSGFNGQAYFDPSEATVARPEKVDSAELGVKGIAIGYAARLGVTGFVYRYRDQQFLSVNPANAVQTLVNVDRSRVYGMEADLHLTPLPTIELDLTGGWLATRVVKGEVSGNDLRGNRLLNAPTATGSAQASWRIVDAGEDRVTLSAIATYTGPQYFEILNTPGLREGGYVVLNGSLRWDHGPWRVSIWGKNLGDRRYFTSRIDLSGFGFDYGHIGTPRTFGASVSREF